LKSVTLEETAWYPLSVDIKSSPQIQSLFLNNNSPANAVEMRGSTLDTMGETILSPWFDLDDQPIIRVVTGKLTVSTEATLRVDAETIVKFDTQGGLDVHGGLVATEAVFTSLRDDEYGGDTDGSTSGEPLWAGIRIHGRKLSRLEDVLIRYADVGLWLEDAEPMIHNLRIEDSWRAALSADISTSPEIETISLDNNAVNGMVLRSEGLPEGDVRWQILGSLDNQVVRVVQKPLVIGANSRLIVDPGVVVKFDNQGQLLVEGDLLVGEGNGALVSFTALSDDGVAGDTDNSLLTPVRGSWLGIVVNPNNTGPRLSLFRMEIRFATIGLNLSDMSTWEFDELTISDSQLYGISCDSLSSFPSEEDGIELLNNGGETLGCPTPDRQEASP
jgi:hypothetical protein